MWCLTVAALIANWRMISLLERRCSTSARISLSRDDRILFVALQYKYSRDYSELLRQYCKAAMALITMSSCGAS